MNELLMQLLGYGGGGSGNYGNTGAPSGPYGYQPQPLIGGNQGYLDPGGPSPTPWQMQNATPMGNGGPTQPIGNMPAGDNKGGPAPSGQQPGPNDTGTHPGWERVGTQIGFRPGQRDPNTYSWVRDPNYGGGTGGTTIGNMPAGNNKGGPQPGGGGTGGVAPSDRPTPPVPWHGLTNAAGDSYGWQPDKGTPQQAGWNPWVKGTGFTRI